MPNASLPRTNWFSDHAPQTLPREYIDFLVAVRPTLKAAAEETDHWQREHRLQLLERANKLIDDMERRWKTPIVYPITARGGLAS